MLDPVRDSTQETVDLLHRDVYISICEDTCAHIWNCCVYMRDTDGQMLEIEKCKITWGACLGGSGG